MYDTMLKRKSYGHFGESFYWWHD